MLWIEITDHVSWKIFSVSVSPQIVVAFVRKGADEMKKLTMALCAAAALASAGTAVAENPAWTYGQIGYFRADSTDENTDGYSLRGSLGIAENFHVQADYVDGELGNSADAEFDGYTVVLGAHTGVSNATDALVEIRWFDLSYDFPGTGVDYDGIGLGVGLRHMLADNVEVNARAWWNDGEGDLSGVDPDLDVDDVSLVLGGRYMFSDNLSAGVTITTNDVTTLGDSANIDLRYQFDDLL
jgi:hypothetical protein